MKVLIVDDHPIVIAGCRTLLASEPDISVIARARRGYRLGALAKRRPGRCDRRSQSSRQSVRLRSDPGDSRTGFAARHHRPHHGLRYCPRVAGDRKRRQRLYWQKRGSRALAHGGADRLRRGHRFVGPDMAQKLTFLDRGRRADAARRPDAARARNLALAA